jgi:hypothetical protein
LARSYCLGYDTVKNFKDKVFLSWMRTDRYRQKDKNTQMVSRWILRSRRSTSAHRLIRYIPFIFTSHVCFLAYVYGFYSIGWKVFLFMYHNQHCFICRPSDSTVSEDAGIEPRTVATSALAVRRSNHSAIDPIHFIVLYDRAILRFFLFCFLGVKINKEEMRLFCVKFCGTFCNSIE